jgi:hypothetical protein
MSRPDWARMLRPSALTTPAVTVAWKPSGLPIAMTSWPGLSAAESPRSAVGSPVAPRRSTARSVSGSSPTNSAAYCAPSGSVARTAAAPWTTWLLVSAKPSGVKTNPEPLPAAGAPRGVPRLGAASVTSRCTTAGPVRSTARTTACEYASKSGSSSTRCPASGAVGAMAASETSFSTASLLPCICCSPSAPRHAAVCGMPYTTNARRAPRFPARRVRGAGAMTTRLVRSRRRWWVSLRLSSRAERGISAARPPEIPRSRSG